MLPNQWKPALLPKALFFPNLDLPFSSSRELQPVVWNNLDIIWELFLANPSTIVNTWFPFFTFQSLKSMHWAWVRLSAMGKCWNACKAMPGHEAVHVRAFTRRVLPHTWGWGHPTVAKAYTCQQYISPAEKHCCCLFLGPDLTHLAQLAQQQTCQLVACHEIWSRSRNIWLHSWICWPCGREVRGEGQRLVPCWKYRAAQSLSLRKKSKLLFFLQVYLWIK